MRNLLIALLCLALFAATAIVHAESPKTSDQWPPLTYAKVVGYRFQLPSDGSNQPVPSGFSLLKNGVVDTKQLEQLKTKSVQLNEGQEKKLLKALVSKKLVYPSACYDPHHIFVFYNGDGKIAAAIEVCFACTSIVTLPTLNQAAWYHHDFITLARLTEELGLWSEKQSVKDWEFTHADALNIPLMP